MSSTTTVRKNAEIKTRTYPTVKRQAAEVYKRWGISLNDAINMFLAKSIEVGGLPFNLRDEAVNYDAISATAYKAPLDVNGIAILPSDWDDDDQ